MVHWVVPLSVGVGVVVEELVLCMIVKVECKELNNYIFVRLYITLCQKKLGLRFEC